MRRALYFDPDPIEPERPHDSKDWTKHDQSHCGCQNGRYLSENFRSVHFMQHGAEVTSGPSEIYRAIVEELNVQIANPRR
ncbi:hypothetical protein AG1IA_05464 [Rhizoctonia solani AG-1 IA]|uniref:Uncharacterized protein n=1 Tax=Thanatephorus cucumeris (strain AG1-IA) TaxID=983506 RepID=L8WVX0_THACA|nr:hypothetical protein AG1IA_05464 [Rhizoctonia solani AG-1 IA]